MSQDTQEEKKDTTLKLQDKDFDDVMNLVNKDAKEKTIILFYSPMCGHCVRMKPAYFDLAESALQGKFGDNVTVASVNTMDNQDLMQRIHSPDMISAREYVVQGVPTIVSYYKGQYYSTYDAGKSEEEKKKFRTLEDLMEYVQGIGVAPITYINKGQ